MACAAVGRSTVVRLRERHPALTLASLRRSIHAAASVAHTASIAARVGSMLRREHRRYGCVVVRGHRTVAASSGDRAAFRPSECPHVGPGLRRGVRTWSGSGASRANVRTWGPVSGRGVRGSRVPVMPWLQGRRCRAHLPDRQVTACTPAGRRARCRRTSTSGCRPSRAATRSGSSASDCSSGWRCS